MNRPLPLALVTALLMTALALPATSQAPAGEAAEDYAAFSANYWNAFTEWLTATNAYWSGFQEWQAAVPEGEPTDNVAYAEHAGPAPENPTPEYTAAFEAWIRRAAGTEVEIDARNDLLTILGNQKQFVEWTDVYVGMIAAAPAHARVGGNASSATYVAEQVGRWGEVHETLLGILEDYPQGDSAPGILYALAEKHQEDGDIDGATSYYERLVAEHTTDWFGEQAAEALYELAELQPGMVAPPFEAVSMAGEAIALKDSLGKVVLLDFWATWCGPCLGEMPNVVELRESFDSDELVILGVSLDDDKDVLATFLEQGKILGINDRTAGEAMAWPQLCDGGGWDTALAQLYRVKGIPRTYVIDATGHIAHKDLRGDELKAALTEMIAPAGGAGADGD